MVNRIFIMVWKGYTTTSMFWSGYVIKMNMMYCEWNYFPVCRWSLYKINNKGTNKWIDLFLIFRGQEWNSGKQHDTLPVNIDFIVKIVYLVFVPLHLPEIYLGDGISFRFSHCALCAFLLILIYTRIYIYIRWLPRELSRFWLFLPRSWYICRLQRSSWRFGCFHHYISCPCRCFLIRMVM